jgi:glucose/arabinose dehydrogenase
MEGNRMRTIRSLMLCSTLVAAALAPAVALAPVASAGTGIRVVPVRTGLEGPAAFTFGPDGTIWFAERGTGKIKVLDRSDGSMRLFADVTAVDGSGERGALGLALHPEYPARPFVYLYVTRTDHGTLVNELIRFRTEGGHPVARRVLFKWAVSNAGNHNGGRIPFGPDGNLWIVVGENADPANAQEVANLRGKILRIRPAGAIPASNPFGTRVYAYGIRNSFGMAFDPFTGRLWESENGPTCNDEINRIVRGGNYAWGPSFSCPADPNDAVAADTNRDGPEPRRFPEARIADTVGVTGAAFCDGCGLGAAREGDLLFGDVTEGGLWALDLTDTRMGADGPPVRLRFAGTSVFSMEVGPGGAIFFSGPDGIYRLAR